MSHRPTPPGALPTSPRRSAAAREPPTWAPDSGSSVGQFRGETHNNCPTDVIHDRPAPPEGQGPLVPAVPLVPEVPLVPLVPAEPLFPLAPLLPEGPIGIGTVVRLSSDVPFGVVTWAETAWLVPGHQARTNPSSVVACTCV